MSRITRIAAVLIGLVTLSGTAVAQAPAKPHLIVIKLVDQPGPKPYAFEPAAFTASRGDTLRFVQAAGVMHNVRFKTQAKGAHLGAAATSPYLTAKGETYNLVVDARFAAGRYELVCDPHEAIGMHALLTVIDASSVGDSPK